MGLWCLRVLAGRAVASPRGGAGANRKLPQLRWPLLAVWAVLQPCAQAVLRRLPSGSLWSCWACWVLWAIICPGCAPDSLLLLVGKQNGCLESPSYSGEAFDVWLCLCMIVNVLVLSHLKTNKILQYILGGAPEHQCWLLSWAWPLCFRVEVGHSVALWAMCLPYKQGCLCWEQSEGDSTVVKVSVTCGPLELTEHGSRGARPVVPSVSHLPAAGMRCVHGLLLGSPPSLGWLLLVIRGWLCQWGLCVPPCPPAAPCKEVGVSWPSLSEVWGRAVWGGMCTPSTQGAGPGRFLSCWHPAWCDLPISGVQVQVLESMQGDLRQMRGDWCVL